MKKSLLLLFACLFGALSGVKAWTSVVPHEGRSYYLHCTVYPNQFWGASKTNGNYYVTSDLSKAVPVCVESINGTTFAMSFYSDGTKYYLHQHDGNINWPTSSSTMEVPEDVNGYAVRNDSYTDGPLWNRKSGHRYMWPYESEGGISISFGQVHDEDAGPDYCWQFISVYEMDPNTPNECASAAETSYLSEANGWERVRDNATLDASLSDYFFAIVCANYPGIMVNMADGNASQQAGGGYTGSKSMWYSNSVNPETDNSFLWMIEKCNETGFEGYTFRNAIYPSLTIQAEGGASHYAHTHDQPNPCQWSSYALTPTDGVFTIKTLANGGDNYLGLWTPSNDYINGQELAGNKSTAEQGKFLIYRKLKNNTNMTSRITNPNFDSNIDGWTATGGFSNNQRNNNLGGDFDGYFWENWDGSAKANKMHQDLTNMPNGFYKLKIAAYVNNLAENNSTQYVFANSDKTYLVTNTPKYYEVWTEVTNNTLSIGLEQTTATANWMAIDNVSLTYSSSLPESVTPITGRMNATVEAAQTSAVEAYAASRTIANINAAMKTKAAAEVSKAAYANAASYLEKVEEVLATTNFYTTAAYNTVYGTYKTAYDNSTLDDATAADLSYKVASSADTERYNANTANDLLIPGWTIGGNDASVSGSGFYINTWSNEGNTDGSGMTTPFYEYWTGDANQLNAKSIVGTLSDLTANSLYYVSALVRVRQQNSQTKADNGITFKVGNGAAVSAVDGTQSSAQSYTSMYYKTVSAFGMTDGDGNLAVTFTVNENSHISWLSFKNVVYTEIGKGDASNLDFATGAVTDGICIRTYAKDITGSDVSGLQNVPSWVILNNGDQRAAGVMNVNSGTGLGNDANVVPSAGYDALSNGKVLGIEAVWSATTQYVQAVTLSAGNYKIVMPIYNQGGTTAFTKNLFGFVESDGTEHYATTTQYAVGSWTWEVIDLTLAKETTGYLSLGYTSASNGNADMPHLFVDRVMICDASANMAVNATAKWGTFCAPFEVAIPDGVTAYTCASATDGKLDLVEVTTGAIPANTPVILNAESGLASTTFYGKKVANATDDLITGGWLRGNVSTSAKDIYYTGNEYLLQRNNNKTGFYKMDDANTYKVGYNRCYLVMPIEFQARDAYYMDGDDFTGINSVEAAEAEGGTLKDGKYLIEGKIVLVKNGVKFGANGQKLN